MATAPSYNQCLPRIARVTSTALIIGCAVTTSTCTLGPNDPVILALGKQTVRRSEFEQHLRSLEARGGASIPPEVRRAVLESFLEERVLVLEARARGVLKPGADAEAEPAAVQQLLADEVLDRLEVSEKEIADFYEAQSEELKVPETVMLRQILVPTENEARDIRRRTLRDPKDFDVLARTRSRGPEASTGGVMGTFARGQLPTELEAAAFSLAPGSTSDVVATSLGYHLLRVDARTPAHTRSLSECRQEIRGRLMRKKSDQSVRQFVRGLLARAKVHYEVAEAL